jgi:hypothetical protein
MLLPGHGGLAGRGRDQIRTDPHPDRHNYARRDHLIDTLAYRDPSCHHHHHTTPLSHGHTRSYRHPDQHTATHRHPNRHAGAYGSTSHGHPCPHGYGIAPHRGASHRNLDPQPECYAHHYAHISREHGGGKVTAERHTPTNPHPAPLNRPVRWANRFWKMKRVKSSSYE